MREGCDGLEVGAGLLEDGGNVFGAVEDGLGARDVDGRRREERILQGYGCLLDIEGGVALPARVDIELPAHACDGGAEETVVDVFGEGAVGGAHRLPAMFEFGEISALFGDGGRGPVARSGGVAMRGISSVENGRYWARQAQKSEASWVSGVDCAETKDETSRSRRAANSRRIGVAG